jgi:hypothetical protein
MKLRSCLLFACMAIVPLVAMFSHKIPRDWRLAAQRLARGEAPVPPTLQSPAPVPPKPVATAAVPVAATPPQRSAAPAVPPPVPALPPAEPAVPPAEPALPLVDVAKPMSPVPTSPVPTSPVPTSPVPTSPVPTSPAAAPGPADTARDRLAIEDQLRALGAVSIECVPMMQGTSHRCSCRVPADPSGQLQRVFQSSNPDPIVALKNLHGQVQFWKHRLAMRPDVANPLRTSGDGGQTGLR